MNFGNAFYQNTLKKNFITIQKKTYGKKKILFYLFVLLIYGNDIWV